MISIGISSISKSLSPAQWSNGNKFVGEFQAGLPSGEGVYETQSGDIFVGRLEGV